tara:strand:- start:592 stop:750 length:159 start_codon:yes stop_codon:yes gene_type:complete
MLSQEENLKIFLIIQEEYIKIVGGLVTATGLVLVKFQIEKENIDHLIKLEIM